MDSRLTSNGLLMTADLCSRSVCRGWSCRRGTAVKYPDEARGCFRCCIRTNRIGDKKGGVRLPAFNYTGQWMHRPVAARHQAAGRKKAPARKRNPPARDKISTQRAMIIQNDLQDAKGTLHGTGGDIDSDGGAG